MASFLSRTFLLTYMHVLFVDWRANYCLGTRDFTVTNTSGLHDCGLGDSEGSRGPYPNTVLGFSAAGRIARILMPDREVLQEFRWCAEI